MRIAFAGSQSVGKTTLIEDLLEVLPDYRSYDEPIRSVAALTGKAPPSIPTMAAERTLIEFASERMRNEPKGAKVLYDRSPIDAYAHAILSMEMGGDVDPAFLMDMMPIVVESLEMCERVVFVPIEPHVGDVADGFRYLDDAGRIRFERILAELLHSPYGPAALARVPVSQVRGNRQHRVEQVRRFT